MVGTPSLFRDLERESHRVLIAFSMASGYTVLVCLVGGRAESVAPRVPSQHTVGDEVGSILYTSAGHACLLPVVILCPGRWVPRTLWPR